ncbi:Clo7bot family Cys-rich peptide [Gottschalkia purinilytica]|nr:Clo7bot family Cys-rich peptide [Gottschalkia purinilytica]
MRFIVKPTNVTQQSYCYCQDCGLKCSQQCGVFNN